MKQLKKKLLLTVGCSLLVVLMLTLYTVNEDTWQALKKLKVNYALIITGVMCLVWFTNGLKLKVLAEGVDFDLPLLSAIEIGLAGSFFANITPSGIGGQPFKIVALTKSKVSSGKASAIVVVELILRLLFFISTLPLIFIKLSNLFVAYINTKLLIISTIVFFLGLLLLIYLQLCRPRYLVLVCFWVLNRGIVAKLISQRKIYAWKRGLVKEIHIFHETLWRYLEDSKMELIVSFLLTILSWGAQFTVIYFIIKSLNLQIDLGYLLLLQLLVYTLVIFIPIPGGSGIEVILASLLQRSIPVSLVGVIVGSWRFFTYYSSIILGGLLAFKVFDIDSSCE
ncbi:lysylphosphatidylglycerol synthase transmembrane domain-containing protein [Halanaerocella petrolearia]